VINEGSFEHTAWWWKKLTQKVDRKKKQKEKCKEALEYDVGKIRTESSIQW